MKQLCILFACLALSVSWQAQAAMEDDPVLGTLFVQQLEQRQGGGDTPMVWSAQGWIGKDLNKFWFKTEGDYSNGAVEESEYQFLYSRAIAPYWDIQMGVRSNVFPTVQRNYLAFSLQGLAPYFFDTDVGLFYDPQTGQGALRLDSDYEMMFTQRLVLIPELEMNAYTQDDATARLGAGLSDLALGLRLAYYFRREFAPYVGINWWQKFGTTANYATADGVATSGTQIVAGLRFWF
jgi:copper resistance protein B